MPVVGDLVADKYRLLAVLGRGGMGVVFDAHHELLDRRVAIKVLAPEVSADAVTVTRFMNEARAAARIASDRVVAVIDVGKLPNGSPYMVMERLQGRDLAQLALAQGPLAVPDVVDLVVEAIEGVAHAHLEGIIHRDLKPSNLYLAQTEQGGAMVKVLDFGISKLTGAGGELSSVTATSTVLGTPLYMSPEQLRGLKGIDVRADVWSLGIITYELLAERVPFTADNLVDLFAAIQESEPRPLTELRADVSPALSDVVLRCLRRAPAERFASAYEMGKTLAPFGGPRARASMDRLDLRLAAKGVGPEKLLSSGVAAAAGAAGLFPSGRTSSPSAPAGSEISGPARGVGEATGAPWAVTGFDGVRPPARGGSSRARVVAASVTGLLVVAGGAFFAVHRGTAARAPAPASASSAAAAASGATDTATPTPLPSETTAGTVAPLPALPPPTASGAASAAPSASSAATASPPSSPASSGAARPPSPNRAKVNPMSMKPF